LTGIATDPHRRTALIAMVQTVIAISAGFALMMLLERVFVAPPGSWPAFAVFSFALLGCPKWFYRFRDAPWFAAAALFGLALQVAVCALDMYDPVGPTWFEPLGACAGAALLGYFAQRRFWLASIIAIPALARAWCLLCYPTFDITNLEHLGWAVRYLLPAPLAPLVGAALADLLRNLRRR
jgi:hypothetical protein